ncbi:hypothetical protein BGX38DRAFT_296109 [Terfezia claveryi]|nr:hypothetical protein BGX38DRAFT_296109 [Terfezia claveryi]
MSSEKPRPTDIKTDAANTGSSRESEFHTVSPVSPLFEEHIHEPASETLQAAVSLTVEDPPAKPPRPLSPHQQAELTLAEAFPTVEPGVIKAILIASRGDIEPAFNALLAMTDPSYVPEEPAPPPAQHPKRAYSPRQQRDYNPALVYQDRIDLATHQPPIVRPRTQLEADELYARQLAEHYNNTGRAKGGGRGGAQNQPKPPHRRSDSEEDYTSEKEHSFLDDDLPIIKENIRKGFLETQSKVNRWVADLKKKIDGELASPELSPTQHDPRAVSSRGGPSGYSSYDADPRVLSDDFAHLELRNSSREEVPPRRPPRPVAKPNLFQSSTAGGNNNGQRKVSFQDVQDDDDLYQAPSPRRSPTTPVVNAPVKQPSPTASKWQPLKSVEPTPLDGDPFSLGDSDDEKDHGLVPEPKAENLKAGAKNTPGQPK